MNRYFELWKVMWNWKKEEQFSTAEFRLTFSSASPRKVLFDLAKIGFIGRIGRDRYRVVSPEKLAEEDYAERIKNGYNILKKSGLKYAFTGIDAVMKWTRGAYNANRFFGFYPIQIKVRKADLQKWKRFLGNADFVMENKPAKRTLFGIFYIFHAEDDFAVHSLGGEPVEPLRETVGYCKKNIATFEHALEILDKMYALGLKIKYEHI